MLQSSSEFNNLGAGIGSGGGFGGGFPFGGGGMGMGGFGLIGLIGLQDLFNRRHDGHGDGDGCAKEIATLAAIGNLKDINVAEARALSAEICDVKANVKDALYASAIQAERNTAELSAQATAFAVAASREADKNAAAILARIGQAQIDDLRDQLDLARRQVSSREVEINVTNSNTNIAQAIAQQAQSQHQWQVEAQHQNDRRFDALFSQYAKSSQDLVNLGTMVGVAQTASPTNIK